MFVWNSYLTGVLRTALGGTQWVVALVHGFVEQRTLSGVVVFVQAFLFDCLCAHG